MNLRLGLVLVLCVVPFSDADVEQPAAAGVDGNVVKKDGDVVKKDGGVGTELNNLIEILGRLPLTQQLFGQQGPASDSQAGRPLLGPLFQGGNQQVGRPWVAQLVQGGRQILKQQQNGRPLNGQLATYVRPVLYQAVRAAPQLNTFLPVFSNLLG